MTSRSGRDLKVLLSIFGPIAVLFIALAFVQYKTLADNRTRVEAQLARQQDLITSLASTALQNNIQEVVQRLDQLGVAAAAAANPSALCEEAGKTYDALKGKVASVAFIDAEGRKAGSVSGGDTVLDLPRDCRFEEFFTAPRLTMVPYLSPLIELPDGSQVVYISCPARDAATGAFAGVALAQVDTSALASLCAISTGMEKEFQLFYYDQRGRCIYPIAGVSPDVRQFQGDMASGIEVSGKVALPGEDAKGDGRGQLHMHPVQVEGYRWYAASLMPLSSLDRMTRDDTVGLVVTGAFFIIALSGGGLYFLRVYKAKDQAELEAGYSASLAKQSGELADEKEKLLAVINSIPDGIMLIGGDGRVLVSNSKMRDILGVAPGGILDADTSFIPDEFPLKPLLGPACSAEATIGGKTYQVLSISVDEPGQKQLREIRVLRDVTLERSLEQKKADLVSMITHDVKSPLSAIIGLSKWIGQETVESGCIAEDVRSGLDAITRAGGRILHIMENFLFLSSIEGMRNLGREDTNLDQFIAKVLLEFQPEAKNKGIRLEYGLAEPSPVVSMDENQMMRAVANLLSNALKYTPEGGTVSVTAKNFRNYVTISVSDTGPGIDRLDMPFIFDRYYRAKSAAAGVKGSGLGLAIAKAVVESHGGTIDVASELGAGATFTLRLPLFPPGKNN